MPVLMKPDVIDASVHNSIEDWNAVKNFGIKGIIHKSTEGTGFVDKRYRERQTAVRRAGMLWGAYHFMTAAPAAAQAKHFLTTAQADENTLLALDWEPYGANTASLAQAKEFLRIVYEETGQRPVLYSGNLVKERGNGDPFLTQHRLWLAQYSSKAQLPRGWTSYWLWQFSGDGYGGHGTIPGISTRGMDVNVFGGVDIAAEWAGRTQDRRATPAPDVVADITTAPSGVPVTNAAAPTIPQQAGMASSLTSATTTAAAINELASQGSRIAQLLRSVKQWFWKVLGFGTGTTMVGSQLIDTTKGNGEVAASWASQHPVALGILVGAGVGILLGGVLLYFFAKRIEKWLVSAFNAGRYEPRKEA